ncbi:MAG TPA: hypothetical protein VFU22_06570 [Roseiflexaceae bacterium]|nr:hypothetical protein [Roseiflexaceae bacterium]
MRATTSFVPRILISALLLITIAMSVLWQSQGRAHQRIDIGAPADDGAALNFHAAEISTSNRNLSFRWSSAASEVRMWALARGEAATLSLRMFPPEGEPRRVSLSIADQKLGNVALMPGPRVYRALLRVPTDREIAIGIASDTEVRSKDPRGIVVGVDWIALDARPDSSRLDIARELWSAPFLPAGLLLLAGCIALLLEPWSHTRGKPAKDAKGNTPIPSPDSSAPLRLRSSASALGLPHLLVGVPALALVALVLLDRLLPDMRLRLASYVFAIGLTALAALAALTLLWRLLWLWPNSDRLAYRWIVATFALAVVLAFTPTIKSDGMGYYVYLRSLTIDGDLNFGNDYLDWPSQKTPGEHLTPRTSTGYYLNFFSIGPAMLWSPLYGAAHGFMLAGSALGQPWQANGYAPIYFVLTTFGSALAGLIVMLAGYRICRRWVGTPTALLAAATLFFGSNLLYYSMREGGFAHALSAATATVFVLAWLRLEERPGMWRWAQLGAAAGLMLVTYWVSGIVLLLAGFSFVRLAVAAIRAPREQRRQRIASLLAGGGIAAALLVLCFSPQMIAWRLIYGAFLTIPQGSSFVSPREFKGVEMLFAPLHGLLPWTPALFVGGFSLLLLFRHSRYLAMALTTAMVAYIVYNAWLPDWHGSGAFGLRRLTLLAPWCMLGLALLFDRLRRWRPLLPVVAAALMVAWSTLVLIRYDLDLIPHNVGALRALSPIAFYLSREIFPLWAVPGWVNNSYIVRQISGMIATGLDAQFIAIVVVMIVSTWAVMAVNRRTTDYQRAMVDK